MKNRQNLNLEDILTDRVHEDDLLEVPLADRIFKVFLLLLGLIFVLALLQFLNIGILKHSFYKNRALLNSARIKNQPAPRGIVFDRFEKPLVQNTPSFNVFLSPVDLPKSLVGRLAVLERIGELLEIDLEELNQSIKKKDWNLGDKIFLKSNIDHNQLVALKSQDVPALKVESALKREHLSKFAFSHLLGYTGFPDDYDLKKNKELSITSELGKSGLEAYYDTFLRGADGKEEIFKNAKGETEGNRIVFLPQVGASLYTFIDKDFQDYFYDRLSVALKNLGRNIGLGIAINPKNGEVLALFNIPSFDNLSLGKFLKEPNEPLFNRAISGLYAPGSTIKPLVATAALKEKVITPTDQIYSQGFIEIPNPYNPEMPSRFLDWKPHGWVDLYSAIARSSNVYFYEVGGGFPAGGGSASGGEGQIGLGIKKLKNWWQKFNLEEKSGIDLVGEKAGFLPDPDWKESKTKIPWRIGDTYNVSIGQGDLLTTPIALLNYINAVASGGVFYKPRIMKKIVKSTGENILESNPEIIRDLKNELGEELVEVRQGMKDAVEKPYGSAYFLSSLPVSVAAKTGTSQVENNSKINALFVGFAPADDPQVAILILVENAREGSLNVVPVAREVLMWYYENRLKN
ncbi:MAG: penicillin-binding transpeptidase domain-containing protein [Patescibacteria group bacterium]